MKLKINDKLAYIAKCANKPIGELSHSIAHALLDNGLVRNDEENFGHRVFECIEDDAPVYTVVKVLMDATGLNKITCDVFDSFCKCMLLGDGECPECGGEMECVNGNYKRIEGTQGSEPEYMPINEDFACAVCGYSEHRDYCE